MGTEQVLYTKDILTPYNTQLDSALLSSWNTDFKRAITDESGLLVGQP